MFRTKSNVSMRRVIRSMAALCLATGGLIIGAQFNSAEATSVSTSVASPTAVFPANAGTLGPIPDGPAACNAYGGNRDVTFTVTGVSGTISNVAVDFTLSPLHTWAGDLDVRLIAPNGVEHVIFSRTGATSAIAAGSPSHIAGPYTFVDTAPASPTWWGAAAASTIASGSYRTSSPGEVPAGGANTLMTPVFAALGAAANGGWILRLRDHCAVDSGSVSAASLTIDTSGLATDAPVDFDGDSRSDYVVVRNIGASPGGQVRWYINYNSTGATQGVDWGIGTDFFVPEDYDGDLKDDVAIWRPGPDARFYILNSNGFTNRIEAFGQTGDDPTVVGDYNNDGRADLAVYRSGVTPEAQSTWYFRTVANGPVTFVPWGKNGDFPGPGDYDGDGRNDFVVQRNSGGGQAIFYRFFASGLQDAVFFGIPSDTIVPGDYDDDGKTDIAVARAAGGVITWFWRPSGGGSDQQVPFGASATDFPVQGDYDGDGRTDQAVWRDGIFWIRNGANGAVSGVGFGVGGPNGDYPVANYNAH